MRVDDHDGEAEFVLGHPNGLLQVRVIRHHDSLVAAAAERIQEEIGGQAPATSASNGRNQQVRAEPL
jgi:hypothetical protein